jgi:hypothetical protein
MTGTWGQEAWLLGKENFMVEKSSGCFRKLKRMEPQWSYLVDTSKDLKDSEDYSAYVPIEMSLLSPPRTRSQLAVPYFVQVKPCCQTARIANISRSRGCM